MRRALLTASTSAPTLGFGNPATAGDVFQTSGRLTVDGVATAPATGTLTTVNFYGATATTITVYVGTYSAPGGNGTFTIRSWYDVTSDGSGAQTGTISLPVVVGDYFAVWTPVSVSQMGTTTRGPWYQSATLGSKPTSGSIAATIATRSLCMNLA